MANRKQPFGYEMKRGEVIICQPEAEAVRHIFRRYGAGASYQDLVTGLQIHSVPYQPGKQWNKNMVARILGDRRYLGEEDFPAIVDQAAFEEAATNKAARGAPTGLTETQKTLRKLCGCKKTEKVERQLIGFLNDLIDDQSSLRHSLSQPNNEERETGLQVQLTEILDRQPIDETEARRLIFVVASAQYENLGTSEYETERLTRRFASEERMEKLNLALLRDTIQEVKVTRGEVRSILMKNGQIMIRGEHQ